ncbi:MAG TPA: PLP-dependent aspartate aminotransferase family protein [Thermomicrobiales bacterium]|jgi:cystathionine gamma-synthase/methionine-gamma-lyase
MTEHEQRPLDGMAFATRAVHAGERPPHPDYTPVVTPIYPGSSFAYDDMQVVDDIFAATREGYAYTRYGNPTNSAMEDAVAALEGTEAAIGFGSGMAALHGAFLGTSVQAGDTVVASRECYGATTTLLQGYFARLGIRTTFVDALDLAALEAAVRREQPKFVTFETVSNPLLHVADGPAITEIAHRAGALVVVDNTFTTPVLMRPAQWGADMVVHSSTKYLGGHGDVTAGVVATTSALRHQLYEINKAIGGILGPFEAWLVLRGLKTLPLRVERQCASAAKVAEWLTTHPAIAHVNYPGLASHPQHALMERLSLTGESGGMISFDIAGADKAAAFRFMEALRLCVAATTLGDVYSLVLYPPMSSHRSLTPEQRAAIGIGDGLIRLSVGIEAVDDIIADLDQALGKVGSRQQAAGSRR